MDLVDNLYEVLKEDSFNLSKEQAQLIIESIRVLFGPCVPILVRPHLRALYPCKIGYPQLSCKMGCYVDYCNYHLQSIGDLIDDIKKF